MRPSESRLPAALALALLGAAIALSAIVASGGCVVPLDDEFTAEAAADAEEADAPLAVDGSDMPDPGCAPLGANVPTLALAGDLRSIGIEGGASLWISDQASLPEGGVAPAAFLVSSGADVDCTGWKATLRGPAFEASPLASKSLILPLDLVATPTGLAIYYQLYVADPQMPLGIRELGVGLAPREGERGAFAPTSELLWSPDRPSYGASVLVVGTTAYAFGCTSTGAFTSSCFVARADVTNLASTAAYAYWTGQDWSFDVDDAASITEAGGAVSVRPDPSGEARYVMTYVPPLGGTLVARSAPAPEGPWSAEVTLATCAVANAGSGAFCSGGQQHPELAGSEGRLVVSYDARTFSKDGGASPGAFWPRLLALDVPRSLP